MRKVLSLSIFLFFLDCSLGMAETNQKSSTDNELFQMRFNFRNMESTMSLEDSSSESEDSSSEKQNERLNGFSFSTDKYYFNNLYIGFNASYAGYSKTTSVGVVETKHTARDFEFGLGFGVPYNFPDLFIVLTPIVNVNTTVLYRGVDIENNSTEHYATPIETSIFYGAVSDDFALLAELKPLSMLSLWVKPALRYTNFHSISDNSLANQNSRKKDIDLKMSFSPVVEVGLDAMLNKNIGVGVKYTWSSITTTPESEKISDTDNKTKELKIQRSAIETGLNISL